MRVRVIAVGTRLPAWARTACSDYLGRLGRPGITLLEISPATRSARGPVRQAVAAEGQRLLGALRASEYVAALDERGIELSSYELAGWLKARRQAGQDLAFVIGGPDGLAPEVLARSNFTLSLSHLTLPHALARVLLAEQLYRAHCILEHHPYHRD